MNKVELVGRTTRDPELRQAATGLSIANFTVAINRPFKGKDGSQEADFINCVVFGQQADNFYKYCPKGSLVGVEGRIQTRNYDAQDGTKRYVTEVIVERIEFLTTKKDSLSNDYVNSNANYSGYVDAPVQETVDTAATPEIDISNDEPYKDFGSSSVALSDDDLPF